MKDGPNDCKAAFQAMIHGIGNFNTVSCQFSIGLRLKNCCSFTGLNSGF